MEKMTFDRTLANSFSQYYLGKEVEFTYVFYMDDVQYTNEVKGKIDGIVIRSDRKDKLIINEHIIDIDEIYDFRFKVPEDGEYYAICPVCREVIRSVYDLVKDEDNPYGMDNERCPSCYASI